MNCERNRSPSCSHFSIGVPAAYVHKCTFRMWMFGYDSKARMMGECGDESLVKPAGDANNTKTSQFGFSLAADSMAHACLECNCCFVRGIHFGDCRHLPRIQPDQMVIQTRGFVKKYIFALARAFLCCHHILQKFHGMSCLWFSTVFVSKTFFRILCTVGRPDAHRHHHNEYDYGQREKHPKQDILSEKIFRTTSEADHVCDEIWNEHISINIEWRNMVCVC